MWVQPVLAKKTIGDAEGTLGLVAGRAGVENRDISTFVGEIINALLGLTGLIFFILMVYGGFLWMTARGEEDRTKKAKTLIISAVIGVIVIVAAYALTNFLFTKLL